MHEGEFGKSRARALICWPVNQCSLEDLVNISWLSFAFSFFSTPSPSPSTFQDIFRFKEEEKKQEKKKNRKKRPKKIRDKNQTTQTHRYSFYFHMPQLESHTTAAESMGVHEYMRSPSRLLGQMNLGCFILKNVYLWLILSTSKQRPTRFESYKCTLFMPVHVGKIKRLAM